jgi:type VII secretion protein EccB
MATKRDLVEAYAFSRRRLVTAFVSGAPGGREVEPARPARTLVGGSALAVLLAAGALIAGVFIPRTPANWGESGLFQSRDDTETYVVVEDAAGGQPPVLHSIRNVTSARLILGGELKPTLVSQEAIDGATLGETLGIEGAPEDVPSPESLIDSGWTACTAANAGVLLRVSTNPGVARVPTAGFVVESAGERYLVAHSGDEAAHSYRLPGRRAAGTADSMLDLLGLPDTSQAVRVSADWLSLFPAGGALAWESFGIVDAGRRVSYARDAKLPPAVRVGDVVETSTASWVLLDTGPARLDDFADAIYRSLPAPHQPTIHALETAPLVERSSPTYLSANWPTGELTSVDGEFCTMLVSAPRERARVLLATDPTAAASAKEVPAGATSPVVEPGHGAFISSGGWSDSDAGTPFVVDARGISYPVDGPQTSSRLGYGDQVPVVVPDSWVELFDDGVPLSVDAALCLRQIASARCD